MVEADTILNAIITVLAAAGAVWGIIRYLNQQKKQREEDEYEATAEHDENLVKRIKIEFENSLEIVRTEVATLRVQSTKQLKRQNKRSDFTNSNVQKVRMDLLDHEQELHRMKKAMATKGMATDEGDTDSLFERNILRKRTEIENDARVQIPPELDEE